MRFRHQLARWIALLSRLSTTPTHRGHKGNVWTTVRRGRALRQPALLLVRLLLLGGHVLCGGGVGDGVLDGVDRGHVSTWCVGSPRRKALHRGIEGLGYLVAEAQEAGGEDVAAS